MIYYLLHNGKNSNLKYFIRSYLREYTPKIFSQMNLERELRKLDSRPDKDYILQRVNYYCKLTPQGFTNREEWDKKAVCLKDQQMTRQKVYYFDAMEFARYFDQSLRWILDSGDKPYVAPEPAIVKNRPLVENNDYSIILKLEKVRHFLFVDDKKPWREKRRLDLTKLL